MCGILTSLLYIIFNFMYIGIYLISFLIFCDFVVIESLRLSVESTLSFAALRPYLRKIKVRNRITRDERERRSEFSKQVHRELRAKYWQRLNPNVNDILMFDDDSSKSYDIDPKRGFVVQEVIPRMVEVADSLKPLPISDKSSETFDRHAGLQFLSNIAGVTSVFLNQFENKPNFKPLSEMGPSELLPRLETDIKYISSLLNVENPTLSNSTKEYMDFLNSLSDTNEMRFLSHSYVFFKEWDISKTTLLTNLRHHLKLVNKLKCAFFDPDARNLEAVLNFLALKWSRKQKNEFLNEMPVAYQKLSESLLVPFTQ